MNEKYTAIYTRRSVYDKDNKSLSLSSQKETCIRHIKNEYGDDVKYKVYEDHGRSGKDVKHRPKFQELMKDVQDGLVDRIVVKKYDRFGRKNRDCVDIMDDLDKLNVALVSVTENIDTSTPSGKTLRGLMFMLAENERETISARVADSYDTKAHETGFYQGGKMYFGYNSVRQEINGKVGSVLVPNGQALAVQKAYEIYAQPEASLTDIVNYIVENGINVAYETGKHKGDNLDRSHLSRLLDSPLYVRADKEVYRYFASQGVEMLDDISAYDGVHGLYLHGIHNNKSGKKPFVKVGYHEGLVDAQTWLAVQDKKSHKSKFQGKEKVLNSWVAGLLKCAHCGRAYTIVAQSNASGEKIWRYFRDGGYATTKGCLRLTPSIRPDDVEDAVFAAMKERLKSLEIAKHEAEQPNPEIETLEAEIIAAEAEIDKLMDKLASADEALFKYINDRVSKLDKHKHELEQKLQSKMRKRRAVDTKPLDEPLSRWSELTTQEKRDVVGKIIEVIRVSDETGIDITFSI